MLTILKMNPIGSKGEQPVIYFEFGFDNPTELPKLAFQIGEDISIVANNSIAVNNKNNVVYKFNGDSWVRTNDKYNSSTKSNTITTNGNYMIANNSIGGFTDINANVEATGLIEKTITENGTYLPAQDEATAYSKVVVDVATSINDIQCSGFGRYDNAKSSWTILGETVLKKPNNGIIELTDTVQILFSTEAVNQIIIPNSFRYSVDLTFTPSSDFTSFSSAEGLTIHMYGDEITPGDGKCYYAYCSKTENPYQGDYFTVTVKKGSIDFSCVIE